MNHIDKTLDTTYYYYVDVQIMGVGMIYSTGTLIRMNKRFFFLDTDTITGDNFDEKSFSAYAGASAAQGAEQDDANGLYTSLSVSMSTQRDQDLQRRQIESLTVPPGASSLNAPSSSSSPSSAKKSGRARGKSKSKKGDENELAQPLLGGDGSGGESKTGSNPPGSGTGIQPGYTRAGNGMMHRRQAFSHEGYLWKRGKIAGRIKLGGRFEWKRRYGQEWERDGRGTGEERERNGRGTGEE